jgi:hypothetical protein
MVLDNIFQMAYVTRDIDKAMENFRAQAEIALNIIMRQKRRYKRRTARP